MATVTSGVVSQTILDTVLADVNAVVPNFSTMVSSYRLLVGAAEEIRRIPGVNPDVAARAIERFDRTGVLIDILIDLLCCKISFSSDLLAVTCAPVDLFRLLANPRDVTSTPHQVAEEIVLLEILRKVEQRIKGTDGPLVPPCTPPGPPPYTFPTSFFQPPPAAPPDFPPHIVPESCLTITDSLEQKQAVDDIAKPSQTADNPPAPSKPDNSEPAPPAARDAPAPDPELAEKPMPAASEKELPPMSPTSEDAPAETGREDTMSLKPRRPRRLKK